MTPEVKKRIEQIRQGIVPEGYVKDKDGIYPRDWASKKIGQWLKLAERPIVLQDEEEYQLVTVRRGFGGVDSRGSFLGKNVLVKNYFIVKTGDFIISKRQIAHGACGIVPPELDGAVVSNEYNVFLPQDGTNIQMFNLMMQLPHYKRLFYLMSDGVHIEKLLFKTQDWMKRTLAMPLLKEQKKIAEILSTQDKAIELQERKIEELKRFKKGCLEKMFPRKGQKVPETRFPGFTGDWEQRKLATMCEKFTDGDWIEAKDQSDAGIRLVQTGNIGIAEYLDKPNNKKWISEETFERLHCEEVYPNDILISRLPEPAGRACIMPNLGTKMITAVDCTIVRPSKDVSANFLLQYLSSQPYFDEVNACLAGGTRQRISRGNLAGFDVPIPLDKTEQDVIGNFLCALDNLITLHQRKLEEMKKQKKALMQLLLTGIVKTKGEVQ